MKDKEGRPTSTLLSFILDPSSFILYFPTSQTQPMPATQRNRIVTTR